ncbi:MAG: MBL fold metallo-hydrolase [Candidatus Sungbacteria bacterium]|nr:MBL fold metallo-hydrolase [Candidatus Sungbacteria bacterium]
MTITWYGQSCFKIETRETILAIDPFSKDIGLAPPRFHADLVLVTHQHHDHNNVAAISPRSPKDEGGGNKKDLTVIDGAGEYEIKGLAVTGISTFHDSREGQDRGPNTVFRIEAEGIVMVHLGDFGESSLREETLDALGNTDVLMTPVGGTYTIDGAAAAKVVNKIEPRIVIPMHYALAGLKIKLAPLENFLKEYGVPGLERLDKLSLKKKDLPEEAKVVILKAQGS